MGTKKEIRFLIWTVVIFMAAFFMPVNSETLLTAIHSTLDLAKWYAREHIVLCLLPAFFIAGVIYRGFCIGRYPCCVFMHYSPVVHQHI